MRNLCLNLALYAFPVTSVAANTLCAMTILLSPVLSDTSSTASSSGSEAVRPAGKSACIDIDTEQGKPAPASAVYPGSAAWSAQPSKTGAAGLRPAGSGRRGKSREHPSARLQLTHAGVQRMLDIGRVDRAAAAMNAAQKAAEQVSYESEWMFQYLQSAKPLLASCYGDEDGEADLLYRRVMAWKAAQDDIKDSLAWAVGKTRPQLDAIRKAWECNVQAYYAMVPSGEEGGLQALLPVDFCALVMGYADGFGSMARCFAAMQTRLEGYEHSATALRQDMAVTTYTLIRLVRWCRVLWTAAVYWNMLNLLGDVFITPVFLHLTFLNRQSMAPLLLRSQPPHAGAAPAQLRSRPQGAAQATRLHRAVRSRGLPL